MRMSPTLGVTPTSFFGISVMRVLRTSLGANTNPANAYRPSRSAMTAAIRKVFVLMNCRKDPSPRWCRSPILPLIALNQPFAFANVPRRQRVALAGVGVLIAPKRHSHRRAHQVKCLAIHIDQIAPVGLRNM